MEYKIAVDSGDLVTVTGKQLNIDINVSNGWCTIDEDDQPVFIAPNNKIQYIARQGKGSDGFDGEVEP